MKQHKNRRILMSLYAAVTSMTVLTGFTSLAAETEPIAIQTTVSGEETTDWGFSDIAGEMHEEVLTET